MSRLIAFVFFLNLISSLGFAQRLSNLENEEVKAAYTPAYETAKVRLEDPEYYPPSAGTPAAKIISLNLLDQNR